VSPARVTGIVLAGGRSTRFGGDKLLAVVGGQPLLHRAIRAVAEVADEIVVVVSAGAVAPTLPPGLAVPVRVARDAVADLGPLAGLAAGLGASAQPLALLVAGDQPALRTQVLRAQLDELGPDPGEADVVVLEDGHHLWPFPVALRVVTVRPAADAALAGGDLRLFDLFRRLRVVRLSAERWRALDPEGESLRDVDERHHLPPS
jgi:molybdopterin-guanine dinucleotide biosynthesis protein A